MKKEVKKKTFDSPILTLSCFENRVAVGSLSGRVSILNVIENSQKAEFCFETSSPIYGVDFSPDGKFVS
jgi:WD40 repeat protein